MVFITEKPRSLAWSRPKNLRICPRESMSSVAESSPSVSQLCPPRDWPHSHSPMWGLLCGGHRQLHAYPRNQTISWKGNSCLQKVLQIPRKDSQWTAQVTCPIISKSTEQEWVSVLRSQGEVLSYINIGDRGKCSRIENRGGGTSLVAHWLRLFASSAGTLGLIPGWGMEIPHIGQQGQRKTRK